MLFWEYKPLNSMAIIFGWTKGWSHLTISLMCLKLTVVVKVDFYFWLFILGTRGTKYYELNFQFFCDLQEYAIEICCSNAIICYVLGTLVYCNKTFVCLFNKK